MDSNNHLVKNLEYIAFAVLFFLVISFTAPLSSNLFENLFHKPMQHAQETLVGDINADGEVDVFDLGIIADCFNKTVTLGHPTLQRCNLKNDDDIIDVFDIGILAGNYGKSLTTLGDEADITTTTSPKATSEAETTIISTPTDQGSTDFTYYVSPEGSNGAEGSFTAPFQTIAHAMSVVQPGESIFVAPGNYEENLKITTSGQATAPITISADTETDISTAVKGNVDILADYIYYSGFDIEGTIKVVGTYNKIENNNIHNGQRTRGIYVSSSPLDGPESSHNQIRRNTVSYAVLVGIQIEGQNNLVEQNTITHILNQPPDQSFTTDADGIRFFGSGHTIRSNRITDIRQDEQVGDPHIDCFQTWETAYNIVFDANFCHNPSTSGSNQIAMIENQNGRVGNITFMNNIFVMDDPGYSPLNLLRKEGQGTIENIHIYNNVFAHPNDFGQYAINVDNISTVTIKNNLFIDYGTDHSYARVTDSSIDADISHNAVYKTNNVAPNGSPYPNDIWMEDPQVTDYAGLDFTLLPTSPLIDAGLEVTAVIQDFAGAARPSSDGYDIGAYEFQQSAVE